MLFLWNLLKFLQDIVELYNGASCIWPLLCEISKCSQAQTMKRDIFDGKPSYFFTVFAKYLVYLSSYGKIQHIQMPQEDSA